MQDPRLTEQISYYRKRATEYDATAYGDLGSASVRIDRLIAQLNPSGEVLEIACGTGMWTSALARAAQNVTAVDSAPEAIELARERVSEPNVTFEVADIFAWQPGRRFDTIFFSAWLSHVPVSLLEQFWNQLSTLLAPNGRVLFIDEHVDESGKESYVAGTDEVITRTLGDGSQFQIVKNFVDPEPLTRRLAELGWSSKIDRDGDDWVLGQARPTPAYVGDPAVQDEWNTRYAEREQLWSGQPNGALVAEVAALTPGRALDVGCGEGADAIWLAGRGWDVTAIEVSGLALQRAAAHAREAGIDVAWVHAELVQAQLEPRSFDLVSAQYPALLRTPDSAAERALLAAVAPGGVLLVVHHAGMEAKLQHDGGIDPADYVWLPMIAALLDEDWAVEVDEQRPRVVPDSGAGAHHVDDLVLRARRLR